MKGGSIVLLPSAPETRGRPRKYFRDRAATAAELAALGRQRRLTQQMEEKGASLRKPASELNLLCVSDIHNQTSAVHELLTLERGTFDAVIVAGDLGSQNAAEIVGLLGRYGAPVLYVLGNWDYAVPDPADLGEGSHHLHLRPFTIGDWTIVGESFPLHDGAPRGGVTESRGHLIDLVNAAGPASTIVVTHDRPTRINRDMPGTRICLYGHIHKFQDAAYAGTRFVNVSALGVLTTIRPTGSSRRRDIRNLVFGQYATIKLLPDRTEVISKTLSNTIPEGWEAIKGVTHVSAPILTI